jgi:hypothetical protein
VTESRCRREISAGRFKDKTQVKVLGGFCVATLLSAAQCWGGPKSPANSVEVSVIAGKPNVAWSRSSAGGLIVGVADFDGTNDSYVWPPGEPSSSETLDELKECLEKVHWDVQFPDRDKTSQPLFVHAAAIRCFESLGLSGYVISHEPDAQEYVVQVSTGNLYDAQPPEKGNRIWASGAPFLGAQRKIQSSQADSKIVAKDVRECRDEATASGVFTSSTSSSGPDSVGWQTTHSSTTIRPMLERFDRCLTNRKYSVQPVGESDAARKP